MRRGGGGGGMQGEQNALCTEGKNSGKPEQRSRCIPIVLCDVQQVEFQSEYLIILSLKA